MIAQSNKTIGNQNGHRSGNIEELRSRARALMQEAVQKLPTEENEAYLEASKRAPSICDSESDPLKFLRRCDYEAGAAAKRLCRYWKERKALFRERAWLPLTLTGDGALTKDDTLSIKAGWPAILPDSRHGKKVVLADRRQFHPVSTSESRQRCTFYIANLISADERSQTEEVLILTLVAMPRAVDIEGDFADRLIWLTRHVFPVKCSYHLFNLATAPEKRFEVQDIVIGCINRHISGGSTLADVHVYFERDSKEELLVELLDLGLTLEGIPTYFGGSWTFVKNTEWCRAQARAEREQRMPRSRRWAARAASSPSTAVAAGESKDAAERQRERNVIHSRRKRERRRQELLDLQDECNQLHGEKDYLMVEQARLLGLLDQAQEQLLVLDEQSAPVLEEERNHLGREKELLLAENQRLMGLLAQAHELVEPTQEESSRHLTRTTATAAAAAASDNKADADTAGPKHS